MSETRKTTIAPIKRRLKRCQERHKATEPYELERGCCRLPLKKSPPWSVGIDEASRRCIGLVRFDDAFSVTPNGVYRACRSGEHLFARILGTSILVGVFDGDAIVESTAFGRADVRVGNTRFDGNGIVHGVRLLDVIIPAVPCNANAESNRNKHQRGERDEGTTQRKLHCMPGVEEDTGKPASAVSVAATPMITGGHRPQEDSVHRGWDT